MSYEFVQFVRADRGEPEARSRYRSSVVLVAMVGAATSTFAGALFFGALALVTATMSG